MSCESIILQKLRSTIIIAVCAFECDYYEIAFVLIENSIHVGVTDFIIDLGRLGVA